MNGMKRNNGCLTHECFSARWPKFNVIIDDDNECRDMTRDDTRDLRSGSWSYSGNNAWNVSLVVSLRPKQMEWPRSSLASDSYKRTKSGSPDLRRVTMTVRRQRRSYSAREIAKASGKSRSSRRCTLTVNRVRNLSFSSARVARRDRVARRWRRSPNSLKAIRCSKFLVVTNSKRLAKAKEHVSSSFRSRASAYARRLVGAGNAGRRRRNERSSLRGFSF